VRKDRSECWIDMGGSGRVSIMPDGRLADGDIVRIVSRPEDVALLPAGETGPNQVTGRIERVSYMGDHLEYTIAAAGRSLVLPAAKKERYPVGADVRIAFDPAHVTALPQ
jgi:ABC-type Fe3+/spermidine/putrescine transport system ATPase subunit